MDSLVTSFQYDKINHKLLSTSTVLFFTLDITPTIANFGHSISANLTKYVFLTGKHVLLNFEAGESTLS